MLTSLLGAHPPWSQKSRDNGQTSPETNSDATLETSISSRGESAAPPKEATGSQMQLVHRARSLSQRQVLPNPGMSSQSQNQNIPSLSDIMSTYTSEPGQDVRFPTIPSLCPSHLHTRGASKSWTVVKIMNRALPPDAELSQEVIDAMEACVLWFIQSTTAEGAAPFVSPRHIANMNIIVESSFIDSQANPI